MKTSVDHLPAVKQRQLAAVVDEILQAVEVEMVILFGSHARGDWIEDPVAGNFSDYDVLVIVQSPETVERHDLWSTIEQSAVRRTAPTELTIIVHDVEDVNRQLELGQYFFSAIKEEGFVLYDAGRVTLSEAKEKTPEERRRYAKQNFEKWFESADDFMIAYEPLAERGRYNIAAFQLHQATERYYTAALLVLTEYKPKSHNLEDLAKRAAAFTPFLCDVFPKNDPEDARLFKLLRNAYIDARYSADYAITEAELRALAARVRELRARVLEMCRERIEEPGNEAS
jgi:HEPN domain-containing protein/predicted nucleotidyltransferase